MPVPGWDVPHDYYAPDLPGVECPECGGRGFTMRIEPTCCGLVHELGYCRGDCAVLHEVQDGCPMCGGEGRLFPLELPRE